MKRHFLQTFMIIFVAVFLIGCGKSIDQSNTSSEPSSQSDNTEPTQFNQEVQPATADQNQKPIENESLSGDKQESNESLPDLTVHYIDAGQADATLFQYDDHGETYTILYDAGDWDRNDVIQYLSTQNITYIDLIIISHPHSDHIGQLAQIMSHFQVGEVWMSGNTTSSSTFQRAIESVLESDADYYEPRAGETFDLGSLEVEVIHPEKLTGRLNEDSISTRITYGNISFLLTGDALKNDELEMLDRTQNIRAQILQLGHHGSNTSSHSKFLEAVNPDIAIYSAGAGNQYGHPHDEVVSRIQNMDIRLYGTDINGTIIVTTDGVEYTVLTKEDGTISPKNTESFIKKEDSTSPANETAPAANCVDINHATLDELQQIIHIGSSRAEDIITMRPFKSVDGLISINGIGQGRMADIKTQGLACVQGG